FGEKAAETLENFAAERAAKAAGMKTKEFRNAYKKGAKKGDAFSEIRKFGKELLDRGIVAAGDSAEEIFRKASLLKKSASQKIHKYLSQFDVLLKSQPDIGFTTTRLASRIESELIDPLRNQPAW